MLNLCVMRLTLLLFSDGASRGNPGPAAAAAVIRDLKEGELAAISQFLGKTTNNQAEYLAVILGLKKALEFSPNEIQIFLDSKLVVEQLAGRWKIKDLELKKLAEKAHALLAKFPKWRIAHIPRAQNKRADSLANQTLDIRGFKKSPVFWRE